MRSALIRAFAIAILPTLALGLALAIAPGRAVLEVRAWLLVVLAIGLLGAIGAIRTAFPGGPSRFDAGPSGRPAVSQPFPTLARLEREVSMAIGSAYDLHFRLRPTLREVAAGLLLARRGIDLDRQPLLAREALGTEAWEIVDPSRPAPDDRRAPGIATPALERVLSSLEAL